jgi:hypothetical protein
MKWHGGRALLNKAGYQSTAAIVAEIENTESVEQDRYYRPRYTLQLSNCDRSISFDIEMHDAAARANSLHKVRTMIKHLQAFEKGLVLENQRTTLRQKARRV